MYTKKLKKIVGNFQQETCMLVGVLQQYPPGIKCYTVYHTTCVKNTQEDLILFFACLFIVVVCYT